MKDNLNTGNKMQKYDSHNFVRYHLIDALRGFALVNMVLFHMMYDIFFIFEADASWIFSPITAVWERFICCSFIILSGVSLNFSKKPLKRGIILNLLGFLITAVTVIFIPSQAIWFGILNFLGCAMMITYALKRFLNNVGSVQGFVFSLIVFALFYGVPDGYIGFFAAEVFKLPDFLYSSDALAFIGFPPAGFYSTDYFPLVPWLFLFFAGYFAWRCVREHGAERLFVRKIPFFDFAGRHSLLIYIVHQPVIMGVLAVAFYFVNI